MLLVDNIDRLDSLHEDCLLTHMYTHRETCMYTYIIHATVAYLVYQFPPYYQKVK